MSDYQGNIIIKNPATPTGPNYNGAAPGIWRLDEVAYWQRQGLWPTQGVGVADTYFPYVAMLMSTTATNAQQNNTFLDSSTNNFTVTRNGNTTQGSVNPYGTLWSNYFDGSGDYLTTPTDAAFGFGTGDFTIELWTFTTAYAGSASVLVDFRSGSEPSVRPDLEYGNTGTFNYRVNGSTVISGGTMPLNTWSHIALCRSSGTTRLFLNGTQIGSSYSDSNNYGSTARCQLGADDDGSPNAYFFGYMSNARVVKGTALYTTTFTPPTSALTAISGTSLLTCQSNRFRDASANNFTITKNGNGLVTSFSPFSPTYPGYSPSAGVSSIYFDGATDWLNLAGQSAFAYGTGAFTIECWFYALGVGQMIIDGRPTFSNGNYVLIAVGGGGTLEYYSNNVGQVLGNTQIQLGAWNHFAIARSGTTTKMFLNGIENASFSDNTNYEAATDRPIIGTNGYRTDLSHFNGYMSNFRIVKGTAVYTSAFTPPSAPVTAISGTSLLLNATNAGIFDGAAINNMETVGNAQVSTTQAKFGTTSVAFDGSGDGLKFPSNSPMSMGTGNFTWEFWVNPATASAGYKSIVDTRTATLSDGFFFGLNPGTLQLVVVSNVTVLTASTSLTANTWQHVALVRSSGTLTIYLGGTSIGSVSNSTNLTSGAGVIGASDSISNPNPFNGYIDDLRITKGVARYTANFTPPTQAFTPY